MQSIAQNKKFKLTKAIINRYKTTKHVALFLIFFLIIDSNFFNLQC